MKKTTLAYNLGWCLTALLLSCSATLPKRSWPTHSMDSFPPLPLTVNQKWGYVNQEGQFVIRAQYEYAKRFREGLAPVKLNGKWGYIDVKGNMVIEPILESTWDFSEGLARVEVGGRQLLPRVSISGSFGFIDKTGNFAIMPQFSNAWDFSEGLAPAKSDGKWGFINRKGKFVIEPQFEDASSFSSGLASVRTTQGKYGFIDKQGKFVIEPVFDWAGSFSEGLAWVLKGDKVSYIDNSGSVVFYIEAHRGQDFHEGLAAVEKPGTYGKYGCIDRTGSWVVKPIFDYIGSFERGLAQVRIGKAWGYIDKQGNYVFKPSE